MSRKFKIKIEKRNILFIYLVFKSNLLYKTNSSENYIQYIKYVYTDRDGFTFLH